MEWALKPRHGVGTYLPQEVKGQDNLQGADQIMLI